MKFKTTTVSPLTVPDGRLIKRPLLEVQLLNAAGDALFDSLALVDSGADQSVLNHEYAVALGLDPTKLEKITIYGLGPDPIEARIGTVQVRITRMKEELELPIYFVDSKTVDVLLGREGFFDTHRVKFDTGKDIFEIVKN